VDAVEAGHSLRQVLEVYKGLARAEVRERTDPARIRPIDERVKVGDPATVYLTGLPQAFAGHVRLLGAIIDPQTRLGDIRIQLKADPALRPGAFARAVVAIDKAQRPVLPQTAVMADASGSYVLIVNAADKVERHAVRVAGTTDNGVIIAEGLSGSERVVATAGGFLRDGETVKIAPPATPAAPKSGTT